MSNIIFWLRISYLYSNDICILNLLPSAVIHLNPQKKLFKKINKLNINTISNSRLSIVIAVCGADPQRTIVHRYNRFLVTMNLPRNIQFSTSTLKVLFALFWNTTDHVTILMYVLMCLDNLFHLNFLLKKKIQFLHKYLFSNYF